MPVEVSGRGRTGRAGRAEPAGLLTPAPAPFLEVEGLSRRFGARAALDQVAFTLSAGDFLVVAGPNGAGKTTLLKILTRVLRPTAGAVRLDGDDWLQAPRARQRELGVLSHETFLYDRLTAAENLRFYATLYRLADPRARATAALAAADLVDCSDQRAGTLSRGQRQRLAIARATLHEPRWLVLDEPYAGLDPGAADALSGRLAALRRSGRTILLTTHDLARAPAAASHFLLLAAGRVRDAGRFGDIPAVELAHRYERALAT